MNRALALVVVASLAMGSFVSCGSSSTDEDRDEVSGELSVPTACEFVSTGHGVAGATEVRVEKLVTGLVVPWSIGFIGARDFLVSERSGVVRLVRDGVLLPQPILRLEDVSPTAERGLLGLAIHPDFVTNRYFYFYYT
ncbi:MAG: PQQ-dependent sugar dehydrogenase, partial [Bdellovibrionota bacterium]